MSDCIFCKIIAGEIPSQKLYEDDDVLAFWDIAPQAPRHLLIIPRRHIATLLELQEEDAGLGDHVLHVASLLADRLGFAETGFRIVANCNADGGQTVWHVHFHLLAGRRLHWPPG